MTRKDYPEDEENLIYQEHDEEDEQIEAAGHEESWAKDGDTDPLADADDDADDDADHAKGGQRAGGNDDDDPFALGEEDRGY
ncbi:MAG: hypothetical protein HKN12_01255 [Gemmatimonadetes bacterium]|nr:hypothetical protein [Gemmatimonadota bacterium]